MDEFGSSDGGEGRERAASDGGREEGGYEGAGVGNPKVDRGRELHEQGMGIQSWTTADLCVHNVAAVGSWSLVRDRRCAKRGERDEGLTWATCEHPLKEAGWSTGKSQAHIGGWQPLGVPAPQAEHQL